MSADGQGPGSPRDEAPQELSADDLTSVPQAPAARQSVASKPHAPPPRTSAPRPIPRATPPTPPVQANVNAISSTDDAPQMILGPRAGTLVGIGSEPRVDETERLVAGPPSPLETQRRLVEPVVAPAPTIEPVISEAEPISVPPSDANVVAHPPVAPPKPADVAVADAPKVVVDAPGAERVIPEHLRETQISLRRVQLQQDATSSGEHATVIDPSRRARGRAIVAIVVGACGVLLLAGVVVAWARGRHAKTSDETTSATGETTTDSKPKATTSSTAKEQGDDTTVASGPTGSTTTASTTGGATKSTTVPKGFGRLTVQAAAGKTPPAGAQIFIEGKSYGAIGDTLVVPCGYRWILAGKADAKGHLTTRLSKSVSVFVQCGPSSDTHSKLTLK